MSDLIGQQLGNYRLLQLLGQGGFADVYLGEHVHLNTMAAIKVLQARLTGGDIEQFRSEARFIAHLQHPHIVHVLDFGVEKNVPFLVMEYAQNGTLRQRHLRDVPIPFTLIHSYVKQIASALQYAHDQKVIHRDIKPENMLLNSKNEVLLSDFGLAMANQSSRQSTKEMIGTVAYMSPEQIQGKPHIASDQYALAIVVYEWLTGVRPFNGTVVEITVQHLSAPPPSMRQKVPAISADIEAVVFKALAKDPAQRFATIEAFAQALEAAIMPTVHLSSMGTISSANPPSGAGNDIPSGVVVSPSPVVLSGPYGKTRLTSNDLTIGRAPDNVYVINDGLVSGHHAVIRSQRQGYVLADLGSSNGTFVNGRRLTSHQPYPLTLNDLIRVGNTQYIYEQDNASQAQLNIPPTVRHSQEISQAPSAPTIADIPGMRQAGAFVTPRFAASSQQGGSSIRWIVMTVLCIILLVATLGGIGVYTFSHNPWPTPTPTAPPVPPTPTDTPVPPTDTPVPTPTDTPVPPTDTPVPPPAQSPYGATPFATMTAFCTDLSNRTYEGAYSLLSRRFQGQVTEPMFASYYNGAQCGQNGPFSPYGSGQQQRVQIGYNTGVVFVCTYYLLQYDSAGWAIDSSGCQR